MHHRLESLYLLLSHHLLVEMLLRNELGNSLSWYSYLKIVKRRDSFISLKKLRIIFLLLLVLKRLTSLLQELMRLSVAR